jgi:sorting nexin-5/6/32
LLQAEQTQQQTCEKFEKISDTAKDELVNFKKRRIQHFKKNLVDLSELELKHARVMSKYVCSFIEMH